MLCKYPPSKSSASWNSRNRNYCNDIAKCLIRSSVFIFSLILTAIKCKSNKKQTKERLNSIYTRPAALRSEAGGGLMATIADSIGSHSNQRGQRDTFQYWPKSNQSERFAYIDEPNRTKPNWTMNGMNFAVLFSFSLRLITNPVRFAQFSEQCA